MRLVRVKRKQEEKGFGAAKLIFTLLNVLEVEIYGKEIVQVDFYQVYNVTELYDFKTLEESVVVA